MVQMECAILMNYFILLLVFITVVSLFAAREGILLTYIRLGMFECREVFLSYVNSA